MTKDAILKILRISSKYLPFGSIAVDIFDELDRSKNITNEKIDKAFNSLKETSALLDALHEDLLKKTEIVSKLKEDYERYSKLSELEEQNIKPMLDEFSKAINKGKGRERLLSLIISLIAGIIIFLLGRI